MGIRLIHIINNVTYNNVSIHFKLTLLPIEVLSRVQKQPVNGKNKHYHRPVHLLHQEEWHAKLSTPNAVADNAQTLKYLLENPLFEDFSFLCI